MEKERPSITTDVVIFTIHQNDLKVLLIKRKINPYKDHWALPGGFVKVNESLEDAAKRELVEETGVTEDSADIYLEQLYTFGHLERDPRGRVITVVYMALINSDDVKLHASTDASDAQWFSVSKFPGLAFDHAKIISYALQRIMWKFEYTTVAFSLLPNKFTISQLQRIYEIVFNKKFDKRNFNKKVLSLNILRGEEVKRDVSYRPPKLYSLKKKIG